MAWGAGLRTIGYSSCGVVDLGIFSSNTDFGVCSFVVCGEALPSARSTLSWFGYFTKGFVSLPVSWFQPLRPRAIFWGARRSILMHWASGGRAYGVSETLGSIDVYIAPPLSGEMPPPVLFLVFIRVNAWLE